MPGDVLQWASKPVPVLSLECCGRYLSVEQPAVCGHSFVILFDHTMLLTNARSRYLGSRVMGGCQRPRAPETTFAATRRRAAFAGGACLTSVLSVVVVRRFSPAALVAALRRAPPEAQRFRAICASG